MYEDCIHGITAEWCSLCKHPRSQPESVEYGAIFAARFEGWCWGCSSPIDPGQPIRQVGDRYGHAACYPDKVNR